MTRARGVSWAASSVTGGGPGAVVVAGQEQEWDVEARQVGQEGFQVPADHHRQGGGGVPGVLDDAGVEGDAGGIERGAGVGRELGDHGLVLCAPGEQVGQQRKPDEQLCEG